MYSSLGYFRGNFSSSCFSKKPPRFPWGFYLWLTYFCILINQWLCLAIGCYNLSITGYGLFKLSERFNLCNFSKRFGIFTNNKECSITDSEYIYRCWIGWEICCRKRDCCEVSLICICLLNISKTWDSRKRNCSCSDRIILLRWSLRWRLRWCSRRSWISNKSTSYPSKWIWSSTCLIISCCLVILKESYELSLVCSSVVLIQDFCIIYTRNCSSRKDYIDKCMIIIPLFNKLISSDKCCLRKLVGGEYSWPIGSHFLDKRSISRRMLLGNSSKHLIRDACWGRYRWSGSCWGTCRRPCCNWWSRRPCRNNSSRKGWKRNFYSCLHHLVSENSILSLKSLYPSTILIQYCLHLTNDNIRISVGRFGECPKRKKETESEKYNFSHSKKR